jgi:sec-independent protein translocase protein TatB
MFGMGFTEILMIAIVAILFLGPDKLPGAMVEVAKFIKSAKKAIFDAKSALDEEVHFADLKAEALSYKAKLEEATKELKGFRNIDGNPMKELTDGVNSVKENFASLTQTPPTSYATATTQIEAKQETITFKKKTLSQEEINTKISERE